ncbi:hypothetical protein FITA111629_07830 [Filibacter tadaridae]|uniref:Uncharacterized protein n=1 Tax=Filibacter tadaridae TaxID=2483811 RepID=A0A3P5XI84_9BACL|nr:hypothetical protein [Filibacter tadaridae]VDC28226.1 hypothetical protein FILTAD_01840 [Filibacter tadaridae]
MKRLGAIIMTVLLIGIIIGSYTVLTREKGKETGAGTGAKIETETETEEDATTDQEEDTTDYMQFVGTVTEIEEDTKEIRLTVEDKDEMIMILRVNDDSLLFNSGTTEQLKKTSLKKGATVEAYYDKNKPMLTIYPATVTPELIIVKDESVFGEVKVSKFDKDFLSLDGELKLNVSKDTLLVNQQGKEITEKELHGKELVVFYAMTTRSLPPQTPPTKIMALD